MNTMTPSNVSPQLADALEQLSQQHTTVLAGGTDIYPALQRIDIPKPALHLQQLSGLNAITEQEHGWHIGAGATWTAVQQAAFPEAFRALVQAASQVGSVQIQNSATVVGNVCNASPAADGVPPLIALGAAVHIASARGTRTVPLEQFIIGVRQTDLAPDELVTGITLPYPKTNTRSDFVKLGARSYLVISIAMLAVSVSHDDQGCITEAAICVGACSPVAQRLTVLEHTLQGCSLTRSALLALFEQHEQLEQGSAAGSGDFLGCLSPIDDVRGSAEYRLHAVWVMLRRVLLGLALD